ncbi:MAG TPA: hypothetical protein PKK61_09980 [Defluviitaleaceae bacterium]|nr:hypothetical protein [Defluviitaleaceae bacterium]
MKAKVEERVIRTFTLEDIDEQTMLHICDALLLAHKSTGAEHYKKIADDMCNSFSLKPTSEPKEEFDDLGFGTSWSLERCLEEVEYGKGFVPRLRLPERFFEDNKHSKVMGFLKGKNGQLGISFWDTVESCIDEDKPYTVWFNKYCADLIINFLRDNVWHDSRDIITLKDCYINNKGRKDPLEHKLTISYNTNIRSFSIQKDFDHIIIDLS